MPNGTYFVEGWPALMSNEIASRYLSVSAERLLQLAAAFNTPVVEGVDDSSRWRKQDLDRLISKLPTAAVTADPGPPMRLLRLDDAQVEAIASAVAQRLEREPSSTGRKLVSIREASTLLGVGRSSIYRMIEDGRLTTTHIGRRTLVHMDTINAIIGDR